MIDEKRRLSVGASSAARVLGTAFGLVFAAAGAVFTVLPFLLAGVLESVSGGAGDCGGIPPEQLPPEIADCAGSGGWFADFEPSALIGLAGIPFVLVGLYLVLHVLRTAAWLDGTTLRVRSALRTRAVDLATASITAGVVTHRNSSTDGPTRVRRVPTLAARDPRTGRTVTMPLQGNGMDHLPPPELRLLAGAMLEGRPSADADVYQVAAQLREMADNPLQLPAR